MWQDCLPSWAALERGKKSSHPGSSSGPCSRYVTRVGSFAPSLEHHSLSAGDARCRGLAVCPRADLITQEREGTDLIKFSSLAPPLPSGWRLPLFVPEFVKFSQVASPTSMVQGCFPGFCQCRRCFCFVLMKPHPIFIRSSSFPSSGQTLVSHDF